MKVYVDQLRCGTVGLCVKHCPEIFRFQDLNGAYQAKFGFPFILAVKGHDKHSILASFAERLENDAAAEFQRALEEIGKIALFRLQELVEAS